MTTAVNSVGNYGYNNSEDYFGLNSGNTAYGTADAYGSLNTYGGYGNYGNIWGGSTQILQNQYDYNNTYNSYNNKYNSEQLSVQDQCAAIATVISNGQEDEVLSEFNELVATIQSQPQYAQCSEQELKAIARNLFQSVTGVSLTDAVNANCSSSFKTGLNMLNPFDKDTTSKEDLISEISGTKKKEGAEIAETAGKVTAVAAPAVGAGIGFAVGGPIGAAVGAGIGWLATKLF